MHDFSPAAELTRLRTTAPLVHNITNYVAMSTMANVLLAIGAAPAMLHTREEVAEFAAIASALTINIGTLSPAWVDGMIISARAAVAAQRPWVFDPVGVGATSYRRHVAVELSALQPTVIRGNASEIITLAQLVTPTAAATDGQGRGVDSTASVAAAETAARQLASALHCVVAVTGAVDFVTDGSDAAWIANGHPLMTRVTALGCALTGVVAAFLAAGSAPFTGTVAALVYYAVAGEIAATMASGPGSFAVQFLDVLAQLEPDTLTRRARIQWNAAA